MHNAMARSSTIPRAREFGGAIPEREIAVSMTSTSREEGKGRGWTAVQYSNREPRWGEKRADEYHAKRLFPNYSQFGRTRTGATMVDTLGREYQIADGIDRLEDQDQHLVARGSPYEVEPSLQESPLGNSIVFSTLGRTTPSYSFPLSEEGVVSSDGGPSRTTGYEVSRGPQLLYVRIPISERRTNPSLTLPAVDEGLQLYHLATGAKAMGKVREVDGFQFPKTATGSVRLDDLTFIIDTNLLSL